MAAAIFLISQAPLEPCYSPSGGGVYSLSRRETIEVTLQDFRDKDIKTEMASIWLILSREACPGKPATMLQGSPGDMEEPRVGAPASSLAKVSANSQHGQAADILTHESEGAFR